MSLLINSTSEEKISERSEVGSITNQVQDDLTLYTETKRVRNSAMPESLKETKRKDAPALRDLFSQTIESKGQTDAVGIKELADSELFVSGLDQLTLQSFILKAEELGKKITYTTTLKIEISE